MLLCEDLDSAQVQQTVQDCFKRIGSGVFDETKGRPLQRLARDWTDLGVCGRRVAKAMGEGQAVLHGALGP